MKHLAATLAWVGDPQMKPYMGAPALATAEAGEAMLAGAHRNGHALFPRCSCRKRDPDNAAALGPAPAADPAGVVEGISPRGGIFNPELV
jgi:hypothetical protein